MAIFKIKEFIIFSSVLICFLQFTGCSDAVDDTRVEQTPIIEKINTNLNWNLADTSYNKVEAKIVDPQGVDNIDSVTITVLTSGGSIVLTDLLYDDGAYYHQNDGDVIAGDGVFSNRFDARAHIGTTIGDYLVEIQVFDMDGNQSEISDTTIHLGYSYRVEFVDIQTPDTLKSGTAAEYIYVALHHPEGLQAIGDVSLNLYEHNTLSLLETTDLFNEGDFENTGDVVAADSIFSFKMDSTFAAGYKGLYDLEFAVTDEFGSVTKSERYGLFMENEVGQILELSVPDQMTRPTSSYIRELITARIIDPQGLSDVDSVYFYSRKPDGDYANGGNPFVLVDNGRPFNPANLFEETGDVKAGDGIYSFSILLYSDAVPGTYVYSFYMRDKVGNLTAVKTDSLEVN